MWEVVYQNEDYGYGYGLSKVGLKTPDCHIIWFAYSSDEGNRYALMIDYAKEICNHMNNINIKEINPMKAVKTVEMPTRK